jgi:hypothetical protein
MVRLYMWLFTMPACQVVVVKAGLTGIVVMVHFVEVGHSHG